MKQCHGSGAKGMKVQLLSELLLSDDIDATITQRKSGI